MSDPIVATIVAFYQACMENPAARGFIWGLVRNVTGWIQKKWFDKTGEAYDPKILGATILKYEVAVNAVAVLLPVEYSGPIVIIADIIWSAARKLLKAK